MNLELLLLFWWVIICEICYAFGKLQMKPSFQTHLPLYNFIKGGAEGSVSSAPVSTGPAFIWFEESSNACCLHRPAICSNLVLPTINRPASKQKKKKVLAKYLLLFDPIWFSVFCVCISMTHGQCQNDGTCVPDEPSPDKTPAEESAAEALWDRSGVKDGANTDRLLVHTHTHVTVTASSHTHPNCNTNR